MNTNYVYIVLTRSHSILSKLIHLITRDEFTHAALAFDRNLDEMFSFGRRYPRNPFVGHFRREQLECGFYAQRTHLHGLVLAIPVTLSQYQRAQEMIRQFSENSRYKYRRTGIFYSLFHIPSQSQYRFVCSEFVYHVLHECEICDLHKPRNLVRPRDFLEIGALVLYKGDLKKRRQPEGGVHVPNAGSKKAI